LLTEVRVPFPFRLVPVPFVILVAAASLATAAEERLPERVEFNRDIRPILSNICFQCHGPDQAQRKADLRLDTEVGATSDLGDGRHAIVAGKPEQSELIRRIISTDPDSMMPPRDFERRLSPGQIKLLTRWIEQGAKWEKHWSFVKPVKATPPVVEKSAWARTPVDVFVLARLEREELGNSEEADRQTLLRRLSFDLTGLPPTPDEVTAYVSDSSADATERVIDRLLASPRYGERMTVRWLNGARYADTSGYQSDGERTMWRWRDWVINAFNDNMPFDEFTIEQLAGDLLPGATLDQRIATGFNRNHRGNAEGGIIPEEFAVEYVVDRVETTATVWLGLTAMCARCHSHKYDPIAQKDFYQLYAYFNNIPEKGRAVKFGNSPPAIISPTRDQQATLDMLDRRCVAAEKNWEAIQAHVASSQSEWERGIVPSVLAADSVRRRMILHLPFDGGIAAAFSAPMIPSRPEGYLGQTRLLASIASNDKPKEDGDPRFAAGRFGPALDCDENHYAAVGDVANFGFFDKFSISAWIRPMGDRGGTIISRMTDVPHGDGWCVVLDKGKLQVHLTKRWLDDACRVETVNPIDTSDWRQIAITYDGRRETSGIRIYVDGEQQPTSILLDELNQSFDNKGPLRIGGGNGPEGRFHGLIDDVRIFDRALTDDEIRILSVTGSLSELAATAPEARSLAQKLALKDYFVQFAADESVRSAWTQVHALHDQRTMFTELLPTTMVMQESPEPRPAHILIRGEYDKRGEAVTSGVPSSLPPLRADAPSNRLGLAQWLVSPEHPLTSRVAVNRIWQMVFGIGLVKTVDDFGQQGEWPSHPELLDWLAVEYQEGHSKHASVANDGWDTKRLLRQIVTSAAYGQSSRTSMELQQRDPENRLLARGPRFRLPAEMIRDAALASSGLLVEQIGGPSVKPYQPEGLWKDLAGLDYEQDHGPSLYRRSLYTFWKRTVAPPSMLAFDAAGRETCIVKETRTNTPLQALNLMNDITYVEASRLLAERMMTDGGTAPADRIRRAFVLLLARPPRTKELDILIADYDQHLSHFRSHHDDADALTKIGEYPRNAELDVVELATCTTVAGLILNLDEAVTRE
jgi:hypothetical protein